MGHRVCSVCYKSKNKMVRERGVFLCLKCHAKSCVVYRPKGMNWRKAFDNLIKYGTFKEQ